MKQIITQITLWLKKLSFRTGIMVAVLCAICYAVSFAQMLLPISLTTKGILWVIFFGLAKTFQYTALLILGKAGIQKLRAYLRKDGGTQADEL